MCNIPTERLKEQNSKQQKKSKNAGETGKEECEAKFCLFGPGAYSKITSRTVWIPCIACKRFSHEASTGDPFSFA